MRWSPQAEAIFGWRAEEVLGCRPSQFGLVHEESLATVQALTRELVSGQSPRNRMLARNNTKDGRTVWCQWYNSAVFDEHGRFASILSMAEDVTARVDAEEQLQKAAVHDALTGLPNRNSLAARLEHAIVRVNRSGDRLALLFIDLDRFKKVNDTLGHAAGDEVLRQVVARVRACVREVDTVARLGGDEFAVLLPDTTAAAAEPVVARLSAALGTRAPHCLGLATAPEQGSSFDELYRSADAELYQCKLLRSPGQEKPLSVEVTQPRA